MFVWEAFTVDSIDNRTVAVADCKLTLLCHTCSW